MKINRVKVELLFGVFKHDITLNQDNGITIVIGENGLGKTIILEAINALFDKNYDFFRTLDFAEFKFYFDNGDIWLLTKKSEDNTFSLFIARDSLSKPFKRIREYKIYSDLEQYSRKASIRDRDRMHRMEMDFEYERNYRMYKDSRYINDLYHNEREYKKMKQVQRHRTLRDDNLDVVSPKWFLEGIAKIRVKLIETQRIITAKETGSDSYVNNLNKCSEELKGMIASADKKSSMVASELDSTYPNRLVRKLRQGSRNSFEELNEALAKLDDRRKLFSSSGLAVKISDSDLLQIDENQKDLVNVLKLYIDDSHKKLDPFEELSKKIKLFKGIINKRFKHKDLEIVQEEGLVFRSTVIKKSEEEFETIPSSKLSSGEQNELILFYKLIFNSYENDMILIDEPELSLHISWQNKFIKDLKEVTSINDVSIVIATHSPDIIDENWDLKVELKGVE